MRTAVPQEEGGYIDLPFQCFEADSQNFASAPSMPRGFTLQNLLAPLRRGPQGDPGRKGGSQPPSPPSDPLCPPPPPPAPPSDPPCPPLSNTSLGAGWRWKRGGRGCPRGLRTGMYWNG